MSRFQHSPDGIDESLIEERVRLSIFDQQIENFGNQ